MNWYLLELNAEPWTAAEASFGRLNGKMRAQFYKNEQLRAYQEAVKETLLEEYPDAPLLSGPIQLEFYIWRQLPAYTQVKGRSVRKHQADATNLQKALEDAIQGILFANDRDVASVQTTIVEQTADTDPCIIVGVQSFLSCAIAPTLRQTLEHYRKVHQSKNTSAFVPPDDLF